jgi:hypothetical protein
VTWPTASAGDTCSSNAQPVGLRNVTEKIGRRMFIISSVIFGQDLDLVHYEGYTIRDLSGLGLCRSHARFTMYKYVRPYQLSQHAAVMFER